MLEEELSFARDLAARAGRAALDIFRSRPEVRLKHDLTPVTQADLDIEEMARREVAARFPRDGVLGEEAGLAPDGHRVWVVDPIDGTRNFAAGIPVWGTLLALVVEGDPVLGVVEAPALGERYEAVRGSGARMNGEPIRVSDVDSLADATVAHPSLTEWQGAPGRDVMLSLLAEARRALGFGDFWGHCLVARGAVEAMAEPSLRVWDWAAVKVVVEEAGGRVTAVDGGALRDGGSVLSTNGRLHDQVVGRFREGSGGGLRGGGPPLPGAGPLR